MDPKIKPDNSGTDHFVILGGDSDSWDPGFDPLDDLLPGELDYD